MLDFLDRIPYPVLAPVAVVLLLAPFTPMPHAVEKVLMLFRGTLKSPLDIFDLVLHTAPTLLLLAKLARDMLD
ncbi:MAG: hypothetical protein ACLFOY_15635 [Desulfatibacillaceae bacterium]